EDSSHGGLPKPLRRVLAADDVRFATKRHAVEVTPSDSTERDPVRAAVAKIRSARSETSKPSI
ncbi:MAG: hypothetical protein ACI81L_003365, partial [Verrucomicrobiales bacterium]